MTTQQSGEAGACETERSQTLVKSLVRTAFRGEPLFRSLRPDFIETVEALMRDAFPRAKLFRSLRPDFIETCKAVAMAKVMSPIVPVSKT